MPAFALPPALRLVLALVSSVGLVACGAVVEPVSASSPVEASGEDEGRAASGHSTSLDAGTDAPTTNLPPRCAVNVTGAVSESWQNSDTRAALSIGADADLTFSCSFDAGEITYTFEPTLQGLTAGAGSYDATEVALYRTCNTGSCPGAYDFETFPYTGHPTCTVLVSRFAPETRGGLAASFTCRSIPIDDDQNPNDLAAVSVSGWIDLPAVAPAASPWTLDAGFTTAELFPVPEAGAAPATMHLSGLYAASSSRAGSAVTQTSSDPRTQILSAWITADGVTYAFDAWFEDGGASLADFSAVGASWCTGACSVDYDAKATCEVTVVEDQGVGGTFVGDVTCGPLRLDANGNTGPIETVSATIDATITQPVPK